MHGKKSLKFITIVIFIAGFGLFGLAGFNLVDLSAFNFAGTGQNKAAGTQADEEAAVRSLPPEPKDRQEVVEIAGGDTYGNLMTRADVPYSVAMAIYDSAEPEYDLVKLRAGKFLDLTYDGESGDLTKLHYQIDSEDELIVERSYAATTTATSTKAASIASTTPDGWVSRVQPIPYEVKEKTVEGTVETSMYQAALDSDIDIRAIIELARAFQWTIDFVMDPRKGDTFKFVYEARYLDGEYIMPGRVLAGQYVNQGESYEVYYFEESEKNKGYFDGEGNSVQKMFLKAPVDFKYISSGYTTGPRYIAAFRRYTSTHMAVDYAAAVGTPIRAVGDGTVTSSGWNSSGYGYLTAVRHNSTYTTRYAHQSRIIVGYGQKVKQGEVIGYVGSTGFSSGPHLHYEMIKNGVKINPLNEILPPGEPIKQENRDRFFETIKPYEEILAN